MREGFFYNGKGSLLPKPVPREKPWKGQRVFLAKLAEKEAVAYSESLGKKSLCRCCGRKNGNREFQMLGWRWPSGFRHYVEAHNVRPSLAFQEFIVGGGADIT